MLKNKDAIIFDLDGTLVDSMWIWKDIDIEFLSERGLELPQNLQKDIEGMSFTETAYHFKNIFDLKESPEELKQIWNDMAFEKYRLEVPKKKGIDKFINMVSEKGIKLGIATSNSRELAQTVLRANNMEQMFDYILTACEVNKGKPAPDIYYSVARHLGTDPNKCLVFEDVVMGIMAGKNAGMEVCAVYDEFSKNDDEEKRKLADYYINTYEDILNNTYEVL